MGGLYFCSSLVCHLLPAMLPWVKSFAKRWKDGLGIESSQLRFVTHGKGKSLKLQNLPVSRMLWYLLLVFTGSKPPETCDNGRTPCRWWSLFKVVARMSYPAPFSLRLHPAMSLVHKLPASFLPHSIYYQIAEI